MVHDAVGRATGRTLSMDSFKSRVFRQDHRAASAPVFAKGVFASMPSLPTLREASEALVEEAISRAGGNQGVAAGLLGLSRTALNRRLKHRDEDF